jgi:Rieske 2Fe-2S family protein
MTSLQAALPGAYYTDPDHWVREVDRVLSHEWYCAGRLTTWGLDTGAAERLAIVDVMGESVLVTRDRDGALSCVVPGHK